MKKRVVIVTGMSGAGKTSAMGILEDMGYHCIDQFPVQILSDLVDLIESSTDPRFNMVALATSANDYPSFKRIFASTNMDVRMLFLDASDETLLLRYKATRRTHPFIVTKLANSLEDAIEMERDLFSAMSDEAFTTLDTTFLTHQELKKRIERVFAIDNKPVFSISFVSFGFKHGVPMDADLMFDVRFLPNPYWEVELRPYSGDDEPVYHYVIDKPETQDFLKRLTDFLDYSFVQYVSEGKNHFTVAIGCTGGQHRSVSVTNYLYNYYKDKYTCFKDHRDKKDLENE